MKIREQQELRTNLASAARNNKSKKLRNVLHASNDDVTFVGVTALHHSNRCVTCIECDLLHVSGRVCYIRQNKGVTYPKPIRAKSLGKRCNILMPETFILFDVKFKTLKFVA